MTVAVMPLVVLMLSLCTTDGGCVQNLEEGFVVCVLIDWEPTKNHCHHHEVVVAIVKSSLVPPYAIKWVVGFPFRIETVMMCVFN